MTQKNQIYRCNVCGNIIEVLHIGVGKLVCCKVEMELLWAKKVGTGAEKHVPVIEKTADGIKVEIGELTHPMEENHFIEWIEVLTNDRIYRKALKPGDKPEAEFKLDIGDISEVTAREYCNVHSLWSS